MYNAVESERERETETETETEAGRQRQGDRETERDTDRDTDRQTDRQTDRYLFVFIREESVDTRNKRSVSYSRVELGCPGNRGSVSARVGLRESVHRLGSSQQLRSVVGVCINSYSSS